MWTSCVWRRRREEETGAQECTTKNKNPTQSCGGKKIPTRLFGRGGFPAKTLFFCFSMFLGFGHFQPCAPICLEIGLLTGLRAHGHTGTRPIHGHTGTRGIHGHTGTRGIHGHTGTRAHWQSRGPQAPRHTSNPRTHRRRNQRNSGNNMTEE